MYTTKSGHWLFLTQTTQVTNNNLNTCWSWVWNLKLPEKIKFLFWLACHNVVPTLSLLNHRNISPSATCSRCGIDDETFLHCVRDCTRSKGIWLQFGFSNPNFFSNMVVCDWLKEGDMGSNSFIFAACIWWAWRHRNLMCLNNEDYSLNHLLFNIHSMATNLKTFFSVFSNSMCVERHIKWNMNNHNSTILNTDGSCLGIPIRAGYGCVIRHNDGFYLSGFSGYIQGVSDILYDELYAIYQGLLLAASMEVEDLVCFSDSLHFINLLKSTTSKFHVYAVWIQDVKELIEHNNVMICHTLREGNRCADFMAKLGASWIEDLTHHASPPLDLLHPLKRDVIGTLYPRD